MDRFFVSYATPDEAWATWIAQQLVDAGHEVRVQAWDFRAGDNFVTEMDEALRWSTRLVAVLTRRYLESSRYGREEWQAAYAAGPGRVLPIRVDDVHPDGLLSPIAYIDLVGLDEPSATAAISAALASKGPPGTPPAFPGLTPIGPLPGHTLPATQVGFPGVVNVTFMNNIAAGAQVGKIAQFGTVHGDVNL